MRIYDVAFYIAIFFLFGMLLGSFFGNEIFLVCILTLCISVFCFFFTQHQFMEKTGAGCQHNYLAFTSIALLAGFFYLSWYASFAFQITAPFSEQLRAEGFVANVAIRENSQALILKLRKPLYGRIQIVTSRYPEFRYGDIVSFEGEIEKPEGEFEGYYLSNRIAGVAVFPKIERIAENKGLRILSALFGFQERFLDGLRRTLPADEASFAGGLVVGNRSSPVSSTLREDLQKSGTSHLVALSGYNITIIIKSLMVALGLASFTRRFRFPLALIIVAFFVLMVGAQASIVRAALMGVIILLASESERLYSARNAIALTAFFMALWNPFVLAYDIGFQLSFAALLGIIYLKPAIERLLHMSRAKGFFSWREHMITTVSAQFAVLPLLLFHFESFSVAGFFTNVLILPVIPHTMFLSFITGVAGFVSGVLASSIGFLLHAILTYELTIIQFFAKIEFLRYNGGGGIAFVIVSYVLIVLFVARMMKKEKTSYAAVQA